LLTFGILGELPGKTNRKNLPVGSQLFKQGDHDNQSENPLLSAVALLPFTACLFAHVVAGTEMKFGNSSCDG
jgi:hypothetical protein